MPRERNSRSSTSWRHAAVKYIADHPDRPLKVRALSRELGIAEEDYADFRALIRGLRVSGELVYGAGRTLALPQRSELLQGVLRLHRRGYGFLECPGRPDLYVPRGRRRGALDGDTVQARLVKPRRRGGDFRAEVVRIIERATVHWVGVLERLGLRWIVRPIGRSPAPLITVTNPTDQAAKPGEMVVVEPLEHTLHGRTVQGRIVERLGDPERRRTRILAVARRYGLPEGFTAEVRSAAEQAAAEPSPGDFEVREDLRELVTVTIDPPDARDFDDAISVRRLPGRQCELGVHIADVSHFVGPGDPVDAEARRRGTSVYLPGHVVPMLPEVLSNDVCSLQPGKARLTKSVFITYDQQARVAGARFANTVTCSCARLTYEQVSRVLAGRKQPLSRAITSLLHVAERLARRIHARRLAEGMIALTMPEVEIRLDAAGEVVGAGAADTSFSHTIIEMFMVEANEAVSRLLTQERIPHLRRIHPEPEPTAGEVFAQVSAALGREVPRILDRRAIRWLLDSVRGQPAEPVVNLLLLRCMAQAFYGPAEEGHFALASEHYCHFTSPIRRYPDLVVHRSLDSYLTQRNSGAVRGRRRKLIPEAELVEIGRAASSAEQRAQRAERDARTTLLLGLMKANVGRPFQGIISGVVPAGAFAQLLPSLAEGLLHVADFGSDEWRFDRRNGRFVGQTTAAIVTVGQEVRVAVAAVDELRQEMRLVPAEGAKIGVVETSLAKLGRGRSRRAQRGRSVARQGRRK